MKTKILFIIPVIFFLFGFEVASQQSSPIENTASQSVVADGVGETEESAVEDAKRNAVDQVCGMVVASWTEVRNFQTVKDVIFSQATGFVKSWQLLSSKKEADDSYSVKIQAQVTEILDEVIKDEAALNLLLQWVNRPRILVAITENIEEAGNLLSLRITNYTITPQTQEGNYDPYHHHFGASWTIVYNHKFLSIH